MRPEKELLKREISDKIKGFPSFIVMNYNKFSANTANDFRRQIGKQGGDVLVVRKRVLLKAADDVGIDLREHSLDGHLGVVFLGSDPLETTKTVVKFSQDRDQIIQLLCGRFDGQFLSGADVERLSKLPGKNEMRAQLLSVFEAPLSQTLAVIEALLTSVPHCLKNKANIEEES